MKALLKNLLKSKITISISLIVILSSCISVKKMEILNPNKTDIFSLNKFNGYYENKSLKDSVNITLWSKLYALERRNSDTTTLNNISSIKLDYDNKKTLTITSFDKNKALGEFKVKAKLRNNYLSLQRKLFLIPIPFIFFRQSERKIILANYKDELIMKYGYEEFAWIVMLAGGNDGIDSYKFKKRRN